MSFFKSFHNLKIFCCTLFICVSQTHCKCSVLYLIKQIKRQKIYSVKFG
nr:MAG TPA: hypothetical protein [Bacteriophage sp.]